MITLNINSSTGKEILNCIKTCSNPFDRSEPSSEELTIRAIEGILVQYSKESVLEVLNQELQRLDGILAEKQGGMTAYEIQLEDKDARWNCKAAINYLKLSE